MKKYRRVYIELTTRCNFRCSFCVAARFHRSDLSYENFCSILDQLEGITPAVYYHVLGEPLLHPDLDRCMAYATSKGIASCITTNGSLLHTKKGKWQGLKISRINVSLHAYPDEGNTVWKEKLERVLEAALDIQKETGSALFFRLWDINAPDDQKIFKDLQECFGVSVDPEAVFTPAGAPLAKDIRIQTEKRFVWPTDAVNGSSRGFCQGLRTHFAILSDGTVVPCCLDAGGQIPLGNVFNTPLKEVLEGNRARAVYDGFSARRAVEPLCASCEYKEKFD